MFNIHISGGLEMMRTAAEATQSRASGLGVGKPTMLGVTILTSIDASTLQDVFGSAKSLQEQIVHMAELAQSAGLDGVVASPQEIESIRSACEDGFVIVTPGVRPEWSSRDDQKRTMTPAEALSAGADYVVIGRPIRQAPNPAEALAQILHELEGKL
jgi:orotidine-5'-phosphate decarboxylase